MGKDLFQIRIEQESIDNLKKCLKRTRWPDEIADSGWKCGSNLEYVKELVYRPLRKMFT